MNKQERKINFIITCVYFSLILLIIVISLKYLLVPLLPFICAFIIVSASQKIIIGINKKANSKKEASVIFVLIFILLSSLILSGILYGLIIELSNLAQNISQNDFSEGFEKLAAKFNSITDSLSKSKLFSQLSGVFSNIPGTNDAGIKDIFAEIIPKIIAFIMRFISFFPAAVIFISIMFISMFYIGYDFEKICEFIILQIPNYAMDTLDETKNIFITTAKELFKSYFLLTFITFLQLFIGFSIIGIDYSLVLATIICFIDLLPILGTGTVLIPWAVISFFVFENLKVSIGLTVLYIVIALFRQIAEPRIVGANIGLSPLLSLISIFLGLKIFGVLGIIISPIIFMTVIRLNEKGFIKLYKNFPENSEDKIKKTKQKFLNFKRQDNK